MIKNRVCVQKSICGLLVVAMLATSLPAFAAPGFTNLSDINKAAQLNQDTTVQDKVKPVIGGLSIVFDPTAKAGKALQLTFDKAAFIKSLTQMVKDYALQLVLQKIQEKTGLNLVAGFGLLNEVLEEKLGHVVDTVAGAQQTAIASDNAIADAESVKAQARDEAIIAADAVEKSQGVSNLCYAAEDAQTMAEGGVAGEIGTGRARTIVDRDGGGGGNTTSHAGRKQAAFKRIKDGGTDKDGKKVPPTTHEVAAVVANKQTDAGSLAQSNTTGSNGAKGPIVYRRDQANAFLSHYISNDSFFGAVKAAGITVKPEADLTAGLDTRAADLLSSAGPQLSLLCFKDAAAGKYILDGFDAAFCGKEYDWETAVKTGYKIGTVDKKPMDNVVDLSTAYVIRDYLVPPPFSSFTPQFLKALADEKNFGAAEVLAKRQAFNNAASIVAGIFNKRIADITPQKLEADDEFSENWRAVYPGSAVPPLPSRKARLDIAAERFRSKDYTKTLIGDITGAQQATALAMSVGLQKDILYSLERIEVLLATMLSNELQDRRSGIEQQINAANSATR